MRKIIEILKTPGAALCRLPDSSSFRIFSDPEEIVFARKSSEVQNAFDGIGQALAKGLHVCAFVSYESSEAFDPALKSKKLTDFPMLYYATYSREPLIFQALGPESCPEIGIYEPELDRGTYVKNVRTILEHIVEGDSYQVNYTFRVPAGIIEEPEEFFIYLFYNHPVPYSAFINTGEHKIISLSPELFIEKKGDCIISRPMKGTAKRAPDSHSDLINAEKLSHDAKNRAENVMIVDMVRNDFGKICIPGSITAKSLFNIETFPTVHQMTSEVSGIISEGKTLFDIFKALFPPASITGAPKIKTAEIIDSLEKSPRKIYTGAIGCFIPNQGDFCFNVAIRTIISSSDCSEFGIGSGIVADSVPEDEWKECLLKSKFINYRPPKFEIFETILWQRGHGYHFIDEHLERMRNSQKYFCRNWNEKSVLDSLEGIKFPPSANLARVRVRISQNGNPTCQFIILEKSGWGKEKIRICVSKDRTDSGNVFLYHKTTNRELYDSKFRIASENGFDEIIFVNEKDEITEGAISNVFIEADGKWLSPPLASGLLPGIWREKTIRSFAAKEKIIYLENLLGANEILIGNSVRTAVRAEIVNILI